MTDYVEIVKMLTLGLAAGVLSGLFGIGGGLVIVPALVILFGFPVKTAVGTSLFVLLLPTGLLGVWQYWKAGTLRPTAGFCIALGLFCGAYFGALYAASISQATMKKLYAVFLAGRRLLLPVLAHETGRPPRRGRGQATPAGGDHRSGGGRSGRPLTARLVLIDRPHIAVRVAQGEFAPAPVLIGRLAGDAEDRSGVQAVLVELIHVGDLDLEMDADADARIGKFLPRGAPGDGASG